MSIAATQRPKLLPLPPMVLDMAVGVASATVSGIARIIGVRGISLSIQAIAAMVTTLNDSRIDQSDKADAPPIPASFMYPLTLQCIVSLSSKGFASFSGSTYTSLVIEQSDDRYRRYVRTLPALDLDALALITPQPSPLVKVLGSQCCCAAYHHFNNQTRAWNTARSSPAGQSSPPVIVQTTV